jgi:hypothetical protein
MVAVFLIDQGLYFGMAFQTFPIGNLVAQFMALGAIAHAFQVCMRFGKFTGGYLAITDQGGQQKQKTDMSKQVAQAI